MSSLLHFNLKDKRMANRREDRVVWIGKQEFAGKHHLEKSAAWVLILCLICGGRREIKL